MIPQIILASGSPRRRELLARLGLPFAVVTSGIDETLDETIPIAEAVARLATRKAESIARELPHGLVIGADTVVVCDDIVLGKPEDACDAARMLRLLRDRWHAVITGVAVVDAASGRVEASEVGTRVRMRLYSDEEIAAYVGSGEPLDRAGAYAIQDRGGALVDRIDGCYLNVVGLPLCEVATLLHRVGIAVSSTGAICTSPSGSLCPRFSLSSASCVPNQDRLS